MTEPSRQSSVRITHYRCSDYDCKTFVLAPEGWDEDRVSSEVHAAQDAYLEQFAKAKDDDAGPPRVGHFPPFKDYPDRTVAEVQAEHEVAKKARSEWEKEQSKQRRTFEHFLTDRGFVSLWSDDAQAFEATCYWGHRHGQGLRYGNDHEVDTMPSPEKLATTDAGGEYEDDDFA